MKKFRLTVGEKTYMVEVAREEDPSLLRVKVDDVEHLVTVEEESQPSRGPSPTSSAAPPTRPLAAPSAPKPSAGGGGGAVVAPLPGLIVSISVSPGQQVQSGAEVCVLEAMKMESKILAESGGEVKEVLVSPGDKVETGQTLVVIA